jgi:hypothetical protein
VKLDSFIAQLEALKAMYGPDIEVAFKAASEKNTPITSATFCFQEETRDWIISLASEVEEDECDYSGEWDEAENDYERKMEGWMDSRGEM